MLFVFRCNNVTNCYLYRAEILGVLDHIIRRSGQYLSAWGDFVITYVTH